MRKPVHILHRGHEVKDIVNLAALAVVEAQQRGYPETVAGPSPLPLLQPFASARS